MTEHDHRHPGDNDYQYNLVIAGLAVMIIFSLAGLWIVERGKRLKIERQLQQNLSAPRGLDALAEIMKDAPKLDRSLLEKKTVDWNGSSREVIMLDTPRAEVLGFQEGDIIHVCIPEDR